MSTRFCPRSWAVALALVAGVVGGSTRNAAAQGCGDAGLAPYRPLEGRHLPIILWDFTDTQRSSTSAQIRAALFNTTNPLKNATEYFRWISYHQVQVTADLLTKPGPLVETWYRDPGRPDSYYDSYNSRISFALDVLNYVDPTINFSKYAKTAVPGETGYVIPLVVILHAGYGHGSSMTFRPGHLTVNYLTGETINGQPVRIRNVVLVPEKYANQLNGGTPVGGWKTPLSVFCHEVAHNYGLPDMTCEVDPSGNWYLTSAGPWDLMSLGALGAGHYAENASFFFDTDHPPNTNPWFKFKLGWIGTSELIDIKQTGIYDLGYYEKTQTTHPKAAIIRLRGDEEFYLLADWNPVDFQPTLQDDGLMIYHFQTSGVSLSPPFPYAVEQADGRYDIECGGLISLPAAGDLWKPGSVFQSSNVPGAQKPFADCNPPGGSWANCNPGQNLIDGTPTGIRVEHLGGIPGGSINGGVRISFSQMGTVAPAPTLSFPRDGEIVSSRPVLYLSNAPRCNEFNIAYSYEFSLASDSGFSNTVETSPLTPEIPSGFTAWAPSSTLAAGTYYWRARSRAAGAWSGYTTAASFIVSSTGRVYVANPGGAALGLHTASGDLNGDGKDDAVVVDFSGKVTMTFGGTFAPAPPGYDTPDVTMSLALEAVSGDNLTLSVGDVNADGFDDLGISCPDFSAGGKLGAVAVVFGRASGWPTALPGPDPAASGVLFLQNSAGGTGSRLMGTCVALAETDAGGSPACADLVIGRPCAPGADGSCDGLGRVDIVKGQASFPVGFQSIDTWNQSGSPVTVVSIRHATRRLGYAVSVGHLVSDYAAPDLAILDYQGQSQIVFLQTYVGPLVWDGLFVLGSPACGRDVEWVDLDGDGDDEIFYPMTAILGGFTAGGTTRACGLRGRTRAQFDADFGSNGTVLVASTSTPGQLDIRTPGPAPDNNLSLASGQVGGSAIKDLLISSEGSTIAGKTRCGALFVWQGNAGLGQSLRLDLNPDAGGYHLEGGGAGDMLGRAVSAGDFNGDGFQDLLTVAHGYPWPGMTGTALIVMGGLTGGSSPSSWSELLGDTPPGAALQLVVHPNPLRGAGVVEFVLTAAGAVELAVFDLQGRLVASTPRQEFAAGRHEIELPGVDEKVGPLAPGLYFVRLRTHEGTLTAKVLKLNN